MLSQQPLVELGGVVARQLGAEVDETVTRRRPRAELPGLGHQLGLVTAVRLSESMPAPAESGGSMHPATNH